VCRDNLNSVEETVVYFNRTGEREIDVVREIIRGNHCGKRILYDELFLLRYNAV
jgi:hypothetical protein